MKDAISEFNPQTEKGNGFKFTDYEPNAFLAFIREAINLFQNMESWKKLRNNAMIEYFSWNRSAEHNLELYRTTLRIKIKTITTRTKRFYNGNSTL